MTVKVTLELEKLIVEKYSSGLSIAQISKMYNVSTDTVRQHLIKTNTKRRDLSESHKGKYSKELSPSWKGGKPKCVVCGKQLTSYKYKYCREHFKTPEWSENIKKTLIGTHPKSEFTYGNIPANKGVFGKASSLWQGGRRITTSKYKAKRKRELKFVPLNEPFKDSEGHHLNKEYVLYIPKKLHKSVFHNVYTEQGMDMINKLVIDWYIEYYGLV